MGLFSRKKATRGLGYTPLMGGRPMRVSRQGNEIVLKPVKRDISVIKARKRR
mgnify:CR=1 FL=1